MMGRVALGAEGDDTAYNSMDLFRIGVQPDTLIESLATCNRLSHGNGHTTRCRCSKTPQHLHCHTVLDVLLDSEHNRRAAPVVGLVLVRAVDTPYSL
jgi:hypothetical protein